MQASEVVNLLLKGCPPTPKASAEAYAPSNIALIKYWGKRDSSLNLPITDSLSLSLADKGARTRISLIEKEQDEYELNGETQDPNSSFSLRLKRFLDLFRFQKERYQIHTQLTIPMAAGLASSACGFAALVMALNALYEWKLDHTALSILSRLGSGSACRSIYSGFVCWKKGNRADGMDSYATPLEHTWPTLRVGLLLLSTSPKSIGSTQAMQNTIDTSALYGAWPGQVSHDLSLLQTALLEKDFNALGRVSEHNALSMHATMLSAWPPIAYSNAETLEAMRKIWKCREAGLELYFTQDAGANLKLLFEEKNRADVVRCFPKIEVVSPFI